MRNVFSEWNYFKTGVSYILNDRLTSFCIWLLHAHYIWSFIKIPLYSDHLLILFRGRPFDSEGGGWHFWFGQIIYFHHVLGRKIYFRVNRGQNIYFQPQQIFEKAKKKKKKKKKGGGGWLVRGFRRGGRTWFSMFCRLLARNIAI